MNPVETFLEFLLYVLIIATGLAMAFTFGYFIAYRERKKDSHLNPEDLKS